MFDFWSIAKKTYTTYDIIVYFKGNWPPFPLKFLVSYNTNKLLKTSSKDVEKISHFLSWFALGHLLGPLGPADHPLPP